VPRQTVELIPRLMSCGIVRPGTAGRPTVATSQYYEQAVKRMQTGRRFTFYHDGQFKDAFITRNDPDRFTLTFANKSGKRVFTHMNEDVTTKYLCSPKIHNSVVLAASKKHQWGTRLN
jgi:hypothetical protein